MKEALELVVKGSGAVVAYACPECGRVFNTKNLAEICCEPVICECGRTCRKPWTACDTCLEKNRQDKERQKFEAAEKLPWEKYDGPVYLNDEYFVDVEDMADRFAYAGIELPEYVWACTTALLTLNAEEIISRELEAQEFYEDAFEHVVAISQLQEAIDEWSEKQSLESWMVDRTRAVLLDGLQDE
jgi:hypothetical protein